MTKEQKKIIADWRKKHDIDEKARLTAKCTELGTSLIKQEKGPALDWAQEQLDIEDLFKATKEAIKLYRNDHANNQSFKNVNSTNK